MNGTFFYIGLGLGLAVACGLRPYLPALLGGALGSGKALGVTFAHGHFHFLQAGWWLLALAVVLALSYMIQLRIGAERFDRVWGPVVSAHAVAIGALVFAGTLCTHGQRWWPGLLGGAIAAAVGRWAALPVLEGARSRLEDQTAKEALTVYLDAASLALALLVALLHPLGYLVAIMLTWFIWRRRGRGGERYAGLRILGR
jgi:hypothetical protein